MAKFINYLKDTKTELKHVSWPSYKQAATYTALVIGISILVALFTGAFDYLFSQGLDWFIQ
ncbi:preprotein translocase subunit SecE [Candidatus Kaiserbacteria bacterium]|nr:preprotein translocase subunit SecE [Candidatus Kaiserbacteria bacterium]